jgi:hypothetical protein
VGFRVGVGVGLRVAVGRGVGVLVGVLAGVLVGVGVAVKAMVAWSQGANTSIRSDFADNGRFAVTRSIA